MVIDYGNGEIATSIENVIRFGKTSMKLVISNILLVVLIFVVLNILYEIFLLAVDNEISKVISKIMSELVFAVFLFFIMTNWLGGVNILENILEPLIFERIPKYIFSFKVGNQPFLVTNGVLLNLDSVWDTLEEIPKRIYEIKSAWLIFIDWVFKSNDYIIFWRYIKDYNRNTSYAYFFWNSFHSYGIQTIKGKLWNDNT